jgi:hypothetical protein
LGVHWSVPILEKLLPPNLSSRLFEAQCNPGLVANSNHTIQLLNSETGDVLKTIPTPYLMRASRKKLRALCAESIDVQWGKTLNDITYDSNGEGLTAHFIDGSKYHGELLVGADGPKSKVREILLDVEKAARTLLDIVYNMSIVNYRDVEKALHVNSAHPYNSFGYNPKGIFSFVARKNKTST